MPDERERVDWMGRMDLERECTKLRTENDALKFKIACILNMACVPAAEYVPALAQIIKECSAT
jgi:hypothetical protein